MSENIPGRFFKAIKDILPNKEANKLPLEITPEAAAHLRELVLRQNPTLAEFPFLGVGENNLIQDIVVNEGGFSPLPGLLKSGFLGSQTDNNELAILFRKLADQNKLDKLLLLGHLHPSGEALVNGIRYTVAPNEGLLLPSAGDSLNGQITNGGDLAFYTSFLRLNPTLHPHAAIAANTPQGPLMRAFDMRELTKIRRYSDMEKVPQITLPL